MNNFPRSSLNAGASPGTTRARPTPPPSPSAQAGGRGASGRRCGRRRTLGDADTASKVRRKKPNCPKIIIEFIHCYRLPLRELLHQRADQASLPRRLLRGGEVRQKRDRRGGGQGDGRKVHFCKKKIPSTFLKFMWENSAAGASGARRTSRDSSPTTD